MRAYPALPWRVGAGGILDFSQPISLQLLKAGELTGQITVDGVTSDAIVTVDETVPDAVEVFFGTTENPRLFKVKPFEGNVTQLTLTNIEQDGSLASIDRITVPEIQFSHALPWDEGEGGGITLRTYANYQDLIDGLLVIVIETGGEEKDGIITYDENDGKYYLGYDENLKCYEVINTDQCHVSFTPISDNSKIVSIEREFPEILSTSPELPWDYDIFGTLNLTDAVEQQFIVDKLRVITINTSTGQINRRRFGLSNGRIECRSSSLWFCWMYSFTGRQSQFSIKTQKSSATTTKVLRFEIV